MVVARILEPVSKLATLRQLSLETASHSLAKELGLSEVQKNRVYEAMDWVLKRQESIEKRLAAKHLTTGSLVLFDLSSTYLEGEHCGLGKFGYSRDKKRGKLQVVFGLVCNGQGCPVAVEVFAGNTSDPTTLEPRLKMLKERFGLEGGIVVGDRGMLPDKQIQQHLKQSEGWDWISGLRAQQIRKLLDGGAFELEALQQEQWLEFTASAYERERLIACYNPALAQQRHQNRQQLLEATEKRLDEIVKATQREHEPLQGKEKIALRVGKVVNRFKMAKHFELEITETAFKYKRNLTGITTEAQLDGVYVLRTSVTVSKFSAMEVLRTYKSLSQVEQAFRCFKSVDLQVRPIFHRLEKRVKAHILVCFLAYYVEWHLRQTLAPLLFAEDDWLGAQARRSTEIEAAQKSDSARNKASIYRNAESLPVHSFQSLLQDLATLCVMTIQPRQRLPTFEKITQPTPLQRQVFKLLQISL